MFKEYLDNNHQNLEVEETFLDVAVKIPDVDFFIVENLLLELEEISSRDAFELHVNVDGTCEVFETYGEQESDNLKVLFDEGYENSYCQLKIYKTPLDGVVSVYFRTELFHYLRKLEFSKGVDIWGTMLESVWGFEVYEKNISIQTKGFVFYSVGEAVGPLDRSMSNDYLNNFQENCSVSPLKTLIFPFYFHLGGSLVDQDVKNYFDEISAFLSLLFISNTVEFLGDGNISIRLNGYKSHYYEDVKVANLSKDVSNLYRLFDWAYSGGEVADKIGLLRNVLSLHVRDGEWLSFDAAVWKAVRSNYQIYLKKNIQSYLEVKNKINTALIDFTDKTQKKVDELIGAFKSNLISILSFLTLTILVNGLKGVGVDAIFSWEYFYLVLIVSVLSFGWLLFLRIELLRQFETSNEIMKKILITSYDQILLEDEIDSSMNVAVTENRTYLKSNLTRYSCWWFGVLLVFILLYMIFVLVVNGGLQAEFCLTWMKLMLKV